MFKSFPVLALFLFSLCAHSQVPGGQALKQKTPKNGIGVELLGNPFSVYYEREICSREAYQLDAVAGINLFSLLLYRLPGISTGLRQRIKLSGSMSFFVGQRLDLLTTTFPNYSFSREKNYNGSRAGHFIGFNYLSVNLNAGLLFHKGPWELAPVYPAFLVSLSAYNDGYDAVPVVYPSISLNSKLSYRF